MRLLLVGIFVFPFGLSLARAQESPDVVLAHYDFEGDDIETGPYTLWIFEGAKGNVSLSTSFHHGGFRSVEIRDKPGDGEFAELQGFFSDKEHGRLYIHFAVLVAKPMETLNIAFAGIAHFSLQEHGLAIWFKTEGGVLHHVTGGRDEPLFPVEAFTWYVFDVVYHVDRGTYDLSIAAEGDEKPVVSLRDQANVLGIPGSQVRKYSFIGDIPGRDGSSAWFYVDDIVILNDVPVSEAPFLAPGRRMLFVDIQNHYQQRLYEQPGCVPVLAYSDFDLSPADLAELGSSGLSTDDLPETASPFLRERLLAIREWREGCRGGSEALDHFRRASRNVPGAKIYSMSEVLALVASQRWKEADALFLSIYSLWQSDPRFPAISASIGLARGDLDYAEEWLSSTSEVVPRRLRHPLIQRLWSGDMGPGLAEALEAEFPAEWPELVSTALSAELRFYVLLWQKRYADARDYASRMTLLMRRMELPEGRWVERAGDAAFYDGEYLDARSRYEETLKLLPDPAPVYLKLSDVHFMLGDLELERAYREKIYGSLRPE
jgi:tetratricopeptide (TPR) repeat protein